MDFNYFYDRGADQFAFYQIPKILITDEKFAGITMESKILYSLMLDRASLSAKNGWLDEDGNFDQKNLAWREIPKNNLALGNEFVTDFAYLTKSSDYWEFVLVELEDAKKKIFTNDKENIYFHSEFNHAYDQITSWKAYVNKNREAILHQIDKLRVPLNENSVRFKYVLVIGRNAEKDNSEKRRAMFAEKSDNDIRVMTYDSLVSQCESVPYNGEKIISHL